MHEKARLLRIGGALAMGAALLLGGCQGCRPAPPGPVTSPARDAAAEAGGPLPPAPRDGGVDGGRSAGASSRIFFARHGDDLLPFGCFDAGRRALTAGADCLRMVGRRPLVEVPPAPGLRARPSVLSARRTRLEYPASGATPEGLRLVLPCEKEAGEQDAFPCEREVSGFGPYAVWPPGALPPVRLLERPGTEADRSADPNARPVPPEIVAVLEPVLTRAQFKKLPPMEVAARHAIDLDGDGADEAILVIAVDAPADEEYYVEATHPELPPSLFYLFLDRGGRYERMSLAQHREIVAAEADGEIVAALDLDGDGAQELWLESHYFEGYEIFLARYRQGRFEIVDHFLDGT